MSSIDTQIDDATPVSTAASPRRVRIREFEPASFPQNELDAESAKALFLGFRGYVDIEIPSFMNEQRWRLTSNGWVGTIPVSDDVHFVLEPKISIGNLFGMLELAYDLKSFHVLDGQIGASTLDEVYDRLAGILAQGVLQRARRGLYRAYVPEDDRLPYLRGSLDVQDVMRRPWDPALLCHFQEHTADVTENRILAWTLFTIARGTTLARSRDTVRGAYRALHGSTTLEHFPAAACVSRLYNRLNEDYQPLHALCRFFLEHTGPTHLLGDRQMFPFLVNMARLYELFVARWLERNLPDRFRLRAQENVTLDAHNNLGINIDLVIYDARTSEPLWVLDTKYKQPETPSADDLSQIVSYAVAKRAREAVLIYPIDLPRPVNTLYGASDIRVRTLRFGLDGSLDEAGARFLDALCTAV